MTRTGETAHDELVRRAARWLRGTMHCGVVLCEVGSGIEQPDAIGWRLSGLLSIMVECKTNRSDFFRDQKKWHRRYLRGVGQQRWFLTPRGLVKPEEVPDGWGLIEAHTRIIRKIKPAPKVTEYDPEIWRLEIPLLYGALRKNELGIPVDRLHAPRPEVDRCG